MFRDSNVLRFLPSKKFSIGFVAILLIIGGGAYLFKKPKAGLKYETLKLSETKQSNANLSFVLKDANKDSDNDGLKDWEEILWKTDPNNPDTDGDGTTDGEEIKQNRDPLKAGPDDKLTAFQPLPPDKEIAIEPQKDILNELARQLVISYFSQKGQGKKPAVSAQDLVQQVLNQGPGQSLEDEFSEKNFKNFSGPTTENKKLYLNRLGGILEKNFEEIKGNEFEILRESLTKENKEELNKLDPYLVAYRKTTDDLQNIAIPENKDYMNLHLLLVNIMKNLEKSVSAVKLAFDDPTQVFFGIRWYLNEAQRWQTFEGDFKNLAAKDGLNFEPKEGGWLILNKFK